MIKPQSFKRNIDKGFHRYEYSKTPHASHGGLNDKEISSVYIVHYHLEPGGVTNIIQSQIEALTETFQVHALSASTSVPAGFSLESSHIRTIPELNYLSSSLKAEEIKEAYERLKEHFFALEQEEALFHFHNPNIGLNPLHALLVSDLVDAGYSVVNHCHDFAEDKRPANLKLLNYVIQDVFGLCRKKVCYKDSPNLTYTVINTRDKRFLLDRGIKKRAISYLPNPAPTITVQEEELARIQQTKKELDIPRDAKVVTYPVRGIARKNLGELLLLATLFPRYYYVQTLAPDPSEQAYYNTWVLLAQDLDLPVRFNAGANHSFVDIIEASNLVVTTSVQEGFGMSYIEPWLFNRPVIGRDITDITVDFKSIGIAFPHLYESLLVPKQSDSPDTDEWADFPDLSQQEQINTIIQANNDYDFAKKIRVKNELETLIRQSVDPTIVAQNRLIIMKKLSIESYGKRLGNIYSALQEAKATSDTNDKNVTFSVMRSHPNRSSDTSLDHSDKAHV